MTRLTDLATLRIDPSHRIGFFYRDKPMTGYLGDTVASAMYDNGVRIFGRSLKYHRPRGLYSLDGESGNALVTVDGLPNVQPGLVQIKEGMRVEAQNYFGSPEWDLYGVLDKFSSLMPAGFYYHIMHKPARLWPFFQNRVRKMAGLGQFNPDWQPGVVDERYLNAEVCVLGGGPAGMNAALAAAETGVRVVLIEAQPYLGGFYDWRTAEYQGRPLYQRGRDMAEAVKETENIEVLSHAFLSGIWGVGHVTGFQVGRDCDYFDERYFEVRAKSVIVATGAWERPSVFENNERPGIMQVNCAHRLANIYGIKPGRRGVLAVGHDLGLEAALDLSQIGVQVMAVADARGHGADQGLVQALSDKGIAYLAGWVATKAHGGKKVEKVSLASLNGPGKRQLDCDLLVTSAGLTPNAGPLYTAGAKMAYDHHVGAFLPIELPPELFVAGRVVGYTTPNAVEASGRLAGFKAASAAGAGAASQIAQSEAALEASGGRVQGSQVVTSPHIGKGSKAFVCFDEDTTVKHVNQSVEVGMDVPELAKRYTAAGTGPSQGGVPGHNLPLVINQFRQSGPAEVLPTTVRPPLVPAQFATYAGFNHDIYKRTPMHETQEKAGAIFRRVGVWKRARYFSDDHSAKEEIQNVRNNVGLIDVSTLGKFRIFGPDALKALERVYVGHMAKVKEGKLKYTAMVNDDGNLIDDGVVTKVGENDYYLTTSTGRAGQTIEWIRFHTRYDGWDFHMVNLTDTLGAINLAGPKAREVLSKLTDDDVSPEGFPFMGYREITLMDRVPARVLRVGFVGELSYEIHLPASWAQTVWDRLMEAGAEFGIKPFGLEAQSVLRLEKGHVIIGTESEIRTSLHDLGLGFLWYRDKPEAKTVGAPALRITENQDGRLKLVGIQLDNAMTKVADGALVVDERMRGHAPSIRYSHALEQTVGLALVEDELAALGTKLTLYDSGQPAQRPTATVVKPPFYDPEGHRLKM